MEIKVGEPLDMGMDIQVPVKMDLGEIGAVEVHLSQEGAIELALDLIKAVFGGRIADKVEFNILHMSKED